MFSFWFSIHSLTRVIQLYTSFTVIHELYSYTRVIQLYTSYARVIQLYMSNTRVIQLYTSYTVIHELYYLARISFFKAIALTNNSLCTCVFIELITVHAEAVILIYRARF